MIIDFHTHVFPDRIAERTVAALSRKGGIPAHSDGTVGGLISSMDRCGCDIAVNLPVLTSPTQFDSITAFASGINGSEVGKRIISFAGIHPDSEDVEQRIAEIRAAGFLGIKLHPDYQRTFFDDARYIRILRAARDAGLITVTHAGYDVGFPNEEIKCTPKRVLRALDAIGGYPRLVLAHLGGNELFGEVIASLAGTDVYFDTSYVLKVATRAEFFAILEKHGEDRILFASDSPWRDVGSEIEHIRSYGLTATAEEKILAKNAMKLLGLDR
ncbi:MAG: amidohydrolase family protein [Clostridia bacterium]|nr:amidohydrolase family protein [Clostridia bacterium]